MGEAITARVLPVLPRLPHQHGKPLGAVLHLTGESGWSDYVGVEGPLSGGEPLDVRELGGHQLIGWQLEMRGLSSRFHQLAWLVEPKRHG